MFKKVNGVKHLEKEGVLSSKLFNRAGSPSQLVVKLPCCQCGVVQHIKAGDGDLIASLPNLVCTQADKEIHHHIHIISNLATGNWNDGDSNQSSPCLGTLNTYGLYILRTVCNIPIINKWLSDTSYYKTFTYDFQRLPMTKRLHMIFQQCTTLVIQGLNPTQQYRTIYILLIGTLKVVFRSRDLTLVPVFKH